jgi:hypothetical protein
MAGGRGRPAKLSVGFRDVSSRCSASEPVVSDSGIPALVTCDLRVRENDIRALDGRGGQAAWTYLR